MSMERAVDLILGGSGALEAVLQEEQFLRPSTKDEEDRRLLRSGRASLGGVALAGGPEEIWRSADAADRRTGLALNSLKFIDPLRRAGHSEQDAQTWLEFVRGWMSWADTARAGGLDSFLPAGQRAVVLAAGLQSFWPVRDDRPEDVVSLLGTHVEVFREKLRAGRIHLIEETVVRGCAAVSMGPTPDEDMAAILGDFLDRYLGHGLAPGGSIGATTSMTRRWVDLYQGIHRSLADPSQLPEPDAVRNRAATELSRLWIHGTVPTGDLVAVGSADSQTEWSDRTPINAAERYCSTASDSGEASDDLVYVNRSGWTFARRGWGETELDFDKETFLALRSGPLESMGREQDNTALWFTARGVTWIGDHPGSAENTWGDRDHHSAVEIDGRYRTLSDAEITRQRQSPECFDFEVRDRAYLPVAVTRRVVYSRGGDFSVVVDQVRSSDEHSGRQNWIIPPDVRIEISDGAAQLSKGDEACDLHWLSVPSPEPTLEVLEEGWQRLSVAFGATSTRLITALVPRGADEQTRCWRTPLGDGLLSISVDRGRHAEQMVIAKEGAGVGSVEEDGEVLAERVISSALNGGLSPEEEDRIRRELRQRLAEVKDRLHGSAADREERRSSLQALRELADELGVSGLRDFGLGAALIDVASTDLRDEIADHPLVSGKKRSPLITWSHVEPLVHEFYGVPIRTVREVSGEVDRGLDRQMLSIDNGQLVAPFLLSTLGSGRTLRVMFHGATDRSRNALPRFERMRSMEQGSSGPVLFVSDPCLDLDASQILTWYAGDEGLNLHELIAQQTKAYADELGCDRILFVGNSGGGFAALQCASYLPDAAVVTFNPQIQVDRYVPRIARTAQEVLFGSQSVSGDTDLAPRMDLIERYRRISFRKRVFFVQNTGDEMHYEHHCKPFADAWSTFGDASDLRLHTPYLGAGHRVPPPDQYMELVEEGEQFVFGN